VRVLHEALLPLRREAASVVSTHHTIELRPNASRSRSRFPFHSSVRRTSRDPVRTSTRRIAVAYETSSQTTVSAWSTTNMPSFPW
jgi:hypothetical protein